MERFIPNYNTDAEANATGERIMREHAPTIIHIFNAARDVTTNYSSAADRTEALLTLAGKLSDTITPYTACKNGCSHCCYMATSITDTEADIIGRYIGRDPAAVPEWTTVNDIIEWRDSAVEKYHGVPCVFLKDSKCSIYPVRPIACRTHHNLLSTSDNCKIAGVAVEDAAVTPSIDMSPFWAAQAQALMDQNFGDIREFFPNA